MNVQFYNFFLFRWRRTNFSLFKMYKILFSNRVSRQVLATLYGLFYFLGGDCCLSVLANMARNSSRLILLSPEVSQDRKIRSACSLLTFFIIWNQNKILFNAMIFGQSRNLHISFFKEVFLLVLFTFKAKH